MRRILLALPDDVTTESCGSCSARLPFECAIFGDYAGPMMMTRPSACIAAELDARIPPREVPHD